MEISSVIQMGYNSLLRKDFAAAREHYIQLIRLLPNQPIGYLGALQARIAGPEEYTLGQIAADVVRCKGMTVDPQYEEATDRVLQFKTGKYDVNLLAYVCLCYDYEAVEVLVDLGIDIHYVNKGGTTGLWYVCHKDIQGKYREDGRKIAKLLLDLDAEVEVTSIGGVALLNSDTDREIAKMIRARKPGVQTGEAMASATSSETTSIATILAVVGAAIGLILGTVLDKFLAGFLWAGLLAAVLGLLGSGFDRIREEGKEGLGKGIRNILIAVAVLAAFLMVTVGGFVGSRPKYGTCPGCGTKMETKYIDYAGRRCSRCD